MQKELTWAKHFLRGVNLIYSVAIPMISIFWLVYNWQSESYVWAFAILIVPLGWFVYGERMRHKKNTEIRKMNQRILNRFNQTEL